MNAARITAISMLSSVLACAAHQAQSDEADAPTEVTIGEQGSAQDPLAGRKPALLVEPQRAPEVNQVRSVAGAPALTVKVDPRVLGVVPGEPLPRLRREGESLRKRDGQLLPSGERAYAVFIAEADPQAGDDQPVPMIVAPCMKLESMERLIQDRGDDLRFTITGQVHTYRGVNYLLPTAQPKPWLVSQREQEQIVNEPSVEEGTESSQGEASEQPTDADSDATRDVEPAKDADLDKPARPSAEDVLSELLQQRGEAPATAETPPANDPRGRSVYETPLVGDAGPLSDPLLLGLDPEQPKAELKEEGEFLIARSGRLIRSADGLHALFVLDADTAGAPEPPMILHNCRLLETMEDTVLKQGDDIAFVVTGQVYVYRGANYLLPTIVKRKFDRGNLE